ncbi:hypothetical protein BDP55DRAFT_639161 [Colletotrichum godetiae]|uniref:Uncharacterized protein n=1 Tax=Colletotrichum godetiae TaxID=1209918 RepID=A0AAJ0A5R7_9PEZI|nr:uncharacterized protein BDP55DRAFT_639161 [Colletotrichum godetiae]KAK1656975.1 hypothetical protein BDP55DRAFT_639161 [Colletotrichum godetiae]
MTTHKEYRPMHEAELKVYGAKYLEIKEEKESRSAVYMRVSETEIRIELFYEDIVIPKAEFDLAMGKHGQNAVLRHTLRRKHKRLGQHSKKKDRLVTARYEFRHPGATTK